MIARKVKFSRSMFCATEFGAILNSLLRDSTRRIAVAKSSQVEDPTLK